jgi:ech hydrogenase subunit A
MAHGPVAGLLTSGVALLCLAGMTKAAQFPFQPWLLGAMVAPTPVSALLHSSTMVKAGVFLVVRLSPLYAGTIMGQMGAVAGAFTFVAASALAIGQSNGKRVLAYSTIANLGLIISCAGIGTPVALTAAIFLIIYHAISKGLLFMCVGTIELRIGSRDIEDMQGVFRLMPLTSVIMVIGMLSMLLPPFGVLMTKWLAIEAAVRLPVGLVLIVLGSGFTVVFWVQWIGNVLTMSHYTASADRRCMPSIRFSLVFMGALVLAGTAAVSPSIAPLRRRISAN